MFWQGGAGAVDGLGWACPDVLVAALAAMAGVFCRGCSRGGCGGIRVRWRWCAGAGADVRGVQ